jgi:hypothetical protein
VGEGETRYTLDGDGEESEDGCRGAETRYGKVTGRSREAVERNADIQPSRTFGKYGRSRLPIREV